MYFITYDNYTKAVITLSAIFIFLSSLTSNAAGLGVCGSTLTQRYFVPDAICVFPNGDIRPYACNMPNTKYVSFSAACSEHDSCYSSPGANKTTCDTRFYKNLTNACRDVLTNSFPNKGRKACYQVAITYNDKVRQQACPAFQNAQSGLGVSNAQCN
jgi:hypothetical protein